MLRNFVFVVLGLVIFICGGMLGPKMWESFTSQQVATVEKNSDEEKQPAQVLTEQEKPLLAPTLSSSTAKSEEKTSIAINDEKIAPEVKTAEQENKENEEDKKFFLDEDKKTDIATEETLTADKKEENADLNKEGVVREIIKNGDSLLVIFEKYTDKKSAYNLSDAIKKIYKVTAFQVGRPYKIIHNAEKNIIERFEYEIDDEEKLILDNSGDKPISYREEILYDKKLAFIKGTIKENPYNTIKELNEDPDKLSHTLLSMFKWDIDFNSEIQAGDSFSVLVEKLYRNGKFKGYGRSIGGSFTNKNKTIESFLYYDANKNEKHYNAKGENMQRFFLRTPLDIIRVTSGYTHRRRHPVYGTYRPHLGIDYGAPSGTRIFAIADGTVTYMGWRGGFGKHITIRHASGLESMYSHLRGYARGIRKGAKVKQGKVIGYVGSTGVSTGPHLDFRLKQNGKYINPRNSKMNSRAASVSKVHKQGYEERKKIIREFMNGTRSLDSYDPKMVDVPGKES